MVKPILYLSLLLLLFGLASSSTEPLRVVPGNKGYRLSNELRSIYAQQSIQGEGYHEANMYLNTTVPSINPDQAGVTDIKCNDDKITLTLNDERAAQQIENWPDSKVMLLVSDKWKCFDETTTQFYLVDNKIVDVPNKEVTFTVQKCDVTKWTNDFRIEVSWIKARPKRRDIGRRFNFEKLYRNLQFLQI